MESPRPRLRGAGVLLALLVALLLPTTTQAAEGAPLGDLYLSASDEGYVPSLTADPFVNFNFYLVAEIDYADIGLPDQQAANGIKAWEAGVSMPSGITVLSRTILPETSLNLGGDDNWIVGTGQNVKAFTTPYALVVYTGLLLSAQTDLQVGITPSNPSSFDPPAAGWAEYNDSGECMLPSGGAAPCLRRFARTRGLWVNGDPGLPPAAPSDLVAWAWDASSIQLEWLDNSTDETGFLVEMATSEAGPYVQVLQLPADVSSATVEGLLPDTTYWFRVYAFNDIGPSDGYAASHATTESEIVPVYEGEPLGDLYLSSFDGGQQDSLVVAPFQNFGWFLVAEIDYSDIGLPEEQASNGIKGWEAKVLIPPEITVINRELFPPTSINLGFPEDNWIVGTGQLVAAADTPLALVRYAGILLAEASDLELGITSSEPSSFDGLGPGWIEWSASGECIGPGGESIGCLRRFADVAGMVINPTGGELPTAPSNMIAEAASPTSIYMQWTDDATGEISFEIRRSGDPALEGTIVGTVPGGITEFTDTGLTPETTYFYRVYAVNAVGRSVDYAADSATTPEAQNTTVGTPLGSLYLSAEPNQWVDFVVPPIAEPFPWYLVAEVDYADIGMPEQQAVNGILAWEARMQYPPEIVVIQRTLQPDLSLNIGDGYDNWIVGTGMNVVADTTPFALVLYQGLVFEEIPETWVGVEPSAPSSFEPPTPGWYEAQISGECWLPIGEPAKCLRPFAHLGGLLFNPFGGVEARIYLDLGDAGGDLGEIVRVPVTAVLNEILVKGNLSAVAGFDMRVVWDPSIGSFVGAETSEATADWLLAANSGEGFAEISMADAEGIAINIDTTTIAWLEFQLAEQRGTGTLSFEEARCFDTTPEEIGLVLGEGTLIAGCDKFDVVDDDEINSADAIVTLRIAVGLVHPSPDQFCAADVDNDGVITAGDGLMILRRAVGLPLVAKAASDRPAAVSILAGQSDELLVQLHDAAALDAVLRLDADGVRIEEATVEGEGLVAAHVQEDGSLKLAWASTHEGDATLRLKLDSSRVESDQLLVELLSATGYAENGKAKETEMDAGSLLLSTRASTIPSRSHLQAAFPNPFNPRTEIRLRMAEPGDATLRMVDAAGRVLRTVRLVGLPAGETMVPWDGTDDRGRRVASGVYFVQLIAKDATDALRVTLIK